MKMDMKFLMRQKAKLINGLSAYLNGQTMCRSWWDDIALYLIWKRGKGSRYGNSFSLSLF